jgi:hypothetical protein
MKRLVAAATLLAIIPALALAQNADHPPRGLGYVFVGAGSGITTPTVGFGGELHVARGFALGAEVGAIGLGGDPNEKTGVGSADLSYHFLHKKTRGHAAPFVGGGYTVFFGHNTHTGTGLWGHKPLMTQGFNVGGGVDIFAEKLVGVRVDVRYHGHGGRILNYVFPDLDQFSFVAVRVALTFW